MGHVLRIGSRASGLALAQTESVVAALRRAWPDLEVRVETIRTAGDRAAGGPVGVGFFVKEIQEALLAGRADLAVHSMKDVPTRGPDALEAESAVPERADPRDCLVLREGAGLADLPTGARVGTSSPRRRAMLRRLRPDIVFIDLRGNVETRLRKLEAGACDAAVLARAGLDRLGLLDGRALVSAACCALDPSAMLPAAGQGALALEFRADDEDVRSLVAPLDHSASRQAVAAERAVVRRLGAGCRTPLGVLGTVDAAGRLALEAWLLSESGERSVRRRAEGSAGEAAAVGVGLAEELLAAGGRELLATDGGKADA